MRVVSLLSLYRLFFILLGRDRIEVFQQFKEPVRDRLNENIIIDRAQMAPDLIRYFRLRRRFFDTKGRQGLYLKSLSRITVRANR